MIITLLSSLTVTVAVYPLTSVTSLTVYLIVLPATFSSRSVQVVVHLLSADNLTGFPPGYHLRIIELQ